MTLWESPYGVPTGDPICAPLSPYGSPPMGPLWASQYGAAVRSLWGPYGVLASPYRCLYGVPMGSQCPPMGSLRGPAVTLWVFPYGVPMGCHRPPLGLHEVPASPCDTTEPYRTPQDPQNPPEPYRTPQDPQNPIEPYRIPQNLIEPYRTPQDPQNPPEPYRTP